MDDYGIPPVEIFFGTTEINTTNHHTWGYTVYVLGAILEGNIAGLNKWEPRSSEGIYLVNYTCHVVSVTLVLNPATDHISSQFHVVFDDECSEFNL